MSFPSISFRDASLAVSPADYSLLMQINLGVYDVACQAAEGYNYLAEAQAFAVSELALMDKAATQDDLDAVAAAVDESDVQRKVEAADVIHAAGIKAVEDGTFAVQKGKAKEEGEVEKALSAFARTYPKSRGARAIFVTECHFHLATMYIRYMLIMESFATTGGESFRDTFGCVGDIDQVKYPVLWEALVTNDRAAVSTWHDAHHD